MSFEGWKEVELGDVLEIKKEIYKPQYREDLPYIGLEHIGQGDLRIHGTGSAKEVESNKYRFKKGDILFGKLRPYFRKVVMPKIDGVCSTDIWVLKTKSPEMADQVFLYYLMASEPIIEMATSSSTGTRMPRADWNHLSKVRIHLPDLPTQKKIAKLLAGLDEKIELNNRINKNLEEMAQTIFKRWFVDFEFPNENGEPYKASGGEFVESELGMIPKGWRVGNLGEIISITSGKRPKNRSANESDDYNVPLVGASSVMGYVKDALFTEPILVIGRVGTHGVVQRYNGKCWPSDNTLVIRSKFHEFVYQFLKTLDYKALNRGSTQPLITQTDVKNSRLIIPLEETLMKFEEIVSPFFRMIERNITQARSLKLIRDTLLPKLMSGEIRVPLD